MPASVPMRALLVSHQFLLELFGVPGFQETVDSIPAVAPSVTPPVPAALPAKAEGAGQEPDTRTLATLLSDLVPRSPRGVPAQRGVLQTVVGDIDVDQGELGVI